MGGECCLRLFKYEGTTQGFFKKKIKQKRAAENRRRCFFQKIRNRRGVYIGVPTVDVFWFVTPVHCSQLCVAGWFELSPQFIIAGWLNPSRSFTTHTTHTRHTHVRISTHEARISLWVETKRTPQAQTRTRLQKALLKTQRGGARQGGSGALP